MLLISPASLKMLTMSGAGLTMLGVGLVCYGLYKILRRVLNI